MEARGRAFSWPRYLVVLSVGLTLGAGVWGVALWRGVLEGYFWALPVVPLFFLLVGALSLWLMRRIVYGGARRLVARMLLVTMGRLVTDVGFSVAGLYLLPGYQLGFVVCVLVCYVVTMLVTIRGLLRPPRYEGASSGEFSGI